jgi:hypothetical protein
LLLIIGLAYLALMIASVPNLADPMVRHDDFPALLADPSGFYIKTLHEGRWLNYWWHLRGIVTPSWLNFTIYQLFWAIFAGAAAVNACGRGELRWYTVALALMIAVAPSAYLISLWFNTLIPGLGLVALFAVLATVLSPAKVRWLLLIFVPLTLMAYTTYPLLLLAICLTSRDARRSWRDLIGLVALFIFSFALGILLIYSLNYFEHGIFGIPMAEWRNPSPARDLTSLLANLGLFADFLANSAQALAFNFTPFIGVHGVLLVGSLIILSRADPWIALYAVTGLLAGLGLLGLQIVLTGIVMPVRAITFVWVFYGIVFVRAALVIHDRGGLSARMTRNALVLIIASYLLQTGLQYVNFRDWQGQTRDMAAQTKGDGPIYVIGSYKALSGAGKAGIQNARGLRLRLVYLTGRAVTLCEGKPLDCSGLDVPPLGTGQQFEVRNLPEHTIIQLRGAG